ncbi:LLM class flavin-dependent oxidoreductase [Asanoa sp. WMMD1127]|uniref:LLM class flavin-dependent oxidoreductase n=1 Tax=Asanoa sp. WMMD1127 TaxID=3016107 RepID=UPI002415EF83|nr:LLM class flavin-dependent oxidoreductase [Asanoa sp. WMMD1127]MDG4823228.1 LLM class flavin-dependent oxidoreductase [Asanoa sp. WMMD1127]
MGLKYAVGLPTVGEFGNVGVLTDLAVSAEQHGWDGVQLWDHLLYHEPGWPVASSTVTAAAIAARTSRLRIILTVVLPRRQVQDVAQDTAAIAALSGGRLTVVGAIGSMEEEYAAFGLDPDLRARGRALDERLGRLTGLWSDWGVDRVPIWCGARWPNRPGLRRAARFDGVMPTFADQRLRNVAVADLAEAAAYVRRLSTGQPDLAVEGATDPARAAEQIAPYGDVGLSWWIEALGWWRGDRATAATRIAAGPPS